MRRPDEISRFRGHVCVYQLARERVARSGRRTSDVFFQSLMEMTVEGFFSDPVYGGNKDMIGWKPIGFPGAYANYYELVDQHGIAFTRPPIGLAQDVREKVHVHPAGAQRPPKGR